MEKKKSTNVSNGSVPIDPKKLDKRDLFEGCCMLAATATLLRQSFGIIAMANSLCDKPLSDKELKDFAAQFDAVHRVVNVMSTGIKKYIDELP